MQQIIDNINSAQTSKQLHQAGAQMREFIKTCNDDIIVAKLKGAFQRKSMRMISPKRVTTNY